MNVRYALAAFLLLLPTLLLAQTPVFQAFEVDTVAQPQGGINYLTTFLNANLRKPIPAQAMGAAGRTIVQGVVEPDGHVSGVTVLKSFRPDCDAEAVRVFNGFRAWRPARKGGQAVRQMVSMPITFAANAPFPYVNGAKVAFYDADQKLLPDSSDKAKFKQLTPLAVNGLPDGDIIVFRLKRSGWDEDYRVEFVRRKIDRKTVSGQSICVLSYGQDGPTSGDIFEVDEAGTLLRQSTRVRGMPVGTEFVFHSDGILAEREEYLEKGRVKTTWCKNGQIAKVWQAMFDPYKEQVASLWDSTGHQLVKDGTGRFVSYELKPSRIDTSRRTLFTEEGDYLAGSKQGRWTGLNADGSYFYAEQFDKGVFQSGKTITAGRDTIRYTEFDHQPEFQGGMSNLGMFLGQNIRYPAEALRSRTQGRVFISFVVCTDGSLCDYKVLKGIGFGCDEEALRVVKMMSGRWKPGVQHGERVRVKYNLPLSFSLE